MALHDDTEVRHKKGRLEAETMFVGVSSAIEALQPNVLTTRA